MTTEFVHADSSGFVLPEYSNEPDWLLCDRISLNRTHWKVQERARVRGKVLSIWNRKIYEIFCNGTVAFGAFSPSLSSYRFWKSQKDRHVCQFHIFGS